MHLIRYDADRIGCLADAGVIDVSDVLPATVDPALRMHALIESWDTYGPIIDQRRRSDPGQPIDGARIHAPVPRPSKIVAAPVNYREHTEEMVGLVGRQLIEQYKGFLKAPSSIVGPSEEIQLPYADRRVDYEGELGVVIGKPARRIAASDALDHVFGYVPLLDMTIRGDEDRSFRKSADTFTPIGPAIATADEVGDPSQLTLELWLNGELRQDAAVRDLVWSVPTLIEAYSELMTLSPGDIIATGTPAGVGQVRPGDRLRLAIAGVGTLEMTVASHISGDSLSGRRDRATIRSGPTC